MPALIEIEALQNYLGEQWVHKDVNLVINQGDIVAIVGGSGAGKTTLLRSILMLHHPTNGSVKVFGEDVLNCSEQQAIAIKHRWGMAFQQNALFASLTVLENVMFPLLELGKLTQALAKELALLKIALVGLPLSAAEKYPAQLSGGMQKRAAIARAIALDPEILFLDEPSSGLDPRSACALDELIVSLRDGLGLTVVMITHDIDTLWRASDKVAFIGEGKVLACLPMHELIKHQHPLINAYFDSQAKRHYGEQ